MVLSTAAIIAVGMGLPFSHAGAVIGMVPLPYFPWLAAMLLAYCGLTQLVKGWYIRRFGAWL